MIDTSYTSSTSDLTTGGSELLGLITTVTRSASPCLLGVGADAIRRFLVLEVTRLVRTQVREGSSYR
jgi:hypothetical protein